MLNISISKSNIKTGGIPSFNTLRGNMAHEYDGYKNDNMYNDLINKYGCITGTCSSDCPGCYAKKMTRYPSVLKNYYINTLIVKTDLQLFENQLNNWIAKNKPKYFRFHDSGDIYSYNHFVVLCKIAIKNPATIFYTYTKEVNIIKQYLTEFKKVPDNFIINISTWDGCNVDTIPGFNIFHYDDNKNSNFVHCPAVDISGKKTNITCIQCKRCFTKHGTKTAVYPH